MLKKGLSFINENQSYYCEYMFVERNFKNVDWEHVEFDEGKSQFLPLLVMLVVYHILSEIQPSKVFFFFLLFQHLTFTV